MAYLNIEEDYPNICADFKVINLDTGEYCEFQEWKHNTSIYTIKKANIKLVYDPIKE